LETDRNAVLMVRLALRRGVDFGEARLRDVHWWRRMNALLRGMAVEEDLALLRTTYAYRCALVGNGNLTPEAFKESQEKARAIFSEILHLTMPWLEGREGRNREEEIGGLIAAYKSEVGDPGDPAFAAKLAADVEASRRRRAALAAETDEQRVDRLLRERDRR
jgi:hypothetical protein